MMSCKVLIVELESTLQKTKNQTKIRSQVAKLGTT